MGALSDFALDLSRNISRQGSLYLRPSPKADPGMRVMNVESGPPMKVRIQNNGYQFILPGDYTLVRSPEWVVKGVLDVAEIEHVDPLYTELVLNSSANVEAGDRLQVFQFRNAGSISDLGVEWSVVETEPDTAGRRTELALDVTLTVSLQQTGDIEMGAIEGLTARAMEVVLTAKPVNYSISTANPLNYGSIANFGPGFWAFDGVVLQASGNINFMGNGSTITLTSTFRVTPDMLVSDRIIALY